MLESIAYFQIPPILRPKQTVRTLQGVLHLAAVRDRNPIQKRRPTCRQSNQFGQACPLHVQGQRRHRHRHVSSQGILIVPRADVGRKRSARHVGRPLQTGLERVGQILLLAAVEVLLKVPGRPKIHGRIEARIGPSARILGVVPPNKEVVGQPKPRRSFESLALPLKTQAERPRIAIAVIVVRRNASRPTPAGVDVGEQFGIPMLSQRLVVPQIFEEEPELPSISIAGQQDALTLLLLAERKPTKWQHQRRGNLSELQVQRPTDHPVVGHHDRLGQMEMKVRIVGVTGRELAAPHMHRFVGLTLRPRCVEHDLVFLGDGVPTQPFARVEVVTEFVLSERLRTVFELRPADPLPQTVLRAKRTNLIVVEPQHDAVGRQLHAPTHNFGLSSQKTQTAVH